MTTITRTVTLIRSGNLKSTLRQARRNWINKQLGKLFAWALNFPAVQEAIADTFDGSTPMCRVLKGAVDDGVDTALQSFTPEADDIRGLDRAVEEAVSSAIDDALDGRDFTQVRGFDRCVQEAIDESDIINEVTKSVVEEIVGRLRS